MAIKDFSFTSQKSDDISERQAIISLESDADSEKLIQILKKSRYRILGDTNQEANESLELVRKHKIGLFFLDFDIKALGSMLVLNKLKTNTPNIKTVVLAKLLNKEQVNDAKKNGVLGFLAKPVSEDAIKKLLSKL
jgi:DNA-binding NarL/FixJ family response regulator